MKKIIFIICLLNSFVFCEDRRFLLLLGPSGAGKSTLIQFLQKIDPRFIYISPYTTRELRPNETDKVHVSIDELHRLELEGKLLTINQLYGIYYATPKDRIDQVLQNGQFPVLDWPIDKLEIMFKHYQEQIFTVYVDPGSVEELERRLTLDGRDLEGKRLRSGREELLRYYEGFYNPILHFKTINGYGLDKECACAIYQAFSSILESSSNDSSYLKHLYTQ